MSDKPTYEELELRCQRLANIIVRNNHATEMILRTEVKKAKATAWDEGQLAGRNNEHHTNWDKPIQNPYKEQS